nr:hypothetical protein Itr_chr03CG06770 [Ipomoea trifida]
MDRWWTYSGSLTRDVLSPSPVRSVKPTSPQEGTVKYAHISKPHVAV